MTDIGKLDRTFQTLYKDNAAAQPARYAAALSAFTAAFGARSNLRLFSAPGRSEISGNHTDHQLGCVLAAAVTLDVIAVASERDDGRITLHSAGYAPMRLSAHELDMRSAERNTSLALVRGVLSYLKQRGYRVGGFDAYISSSVPKGSGLSSSAAYSVLIGTIISYLFNGGRITAVEQALAGKHAENKYFGKPSGLMDQLACACGGFVEIDFADPENPVVERIDCDITALGYAVCIVNAGGSHANLTPEYAAVPKEMCAVAEQFGKMHLREVDERAFYDRLPSLRNRVSDRALLRAMHFFGENARVRTQGAALRRGDMDAFKRLMLESGESSFMLLQNVCPTDAGERSVALALALTQRELSGIGAWRIHGGGFAGTILALVPSAGAASYSREMERVFGPDCCYQLSVRPVGGVELQA